MFAAAVTQLLWVDPGVAPRVEVVVHGTVQCAGARLLEAVEEQLTGTGTSESFTRANVSLRRQDEGWTADIKLATPSGAGVRTVHASTCDALLSDVAFLIAFTAEQGVAAQATRTHPARDALRTVVPPSEPASEARSGSRFVPQPDPVPQPREGRGSPDTPPKNTSRAHRPTPALDLVALGGMDAVSLPGVGALVGVAAGLRGDRWRAELGYQHRVRREVRHVPTRGVELSTHEARARACLVGRTRRKLRPLVCAGTALGSFRARGTGSLLSRSGSKMWWTGLASTGIRWQAVRWLALGPDVSLDVPILRPGAVIHGDGTVVTVGPVGVSAALVLHWTVFASRGGTTGAP